MIFAPNSAKALAKLSASPRPAPVMTIDLPWSENFARKVRRGTIFTSRPNTSAAHHEAGGWGAELYHLSPIRPFLQAYDCVQVLHQPIAGVTCHTELHHAIGVLGFTKVDLDVFRTDPRRTSTLPSLQRQASTHCHRNQHPQDVGSLLCHFC